MKKTLLFLVAVMAMVCNTAMAEDILWQENFSSYEKNAVPAGGDYKYVCADGGSATKIYAENLAGGTAPELLISKGGGKFSATVALKGKNGQFTLTFQCNKNYITVEATGAQVGERTANGNSYSYPLTVAAGTSEVTIVFSNANSANLRFDNPKLYQGEAALKPAGLSWGTASREVTIGSTENKFPELANTNNLPVTYASSDTGVATINAEGVITLVAEGKTTISAAFAGNDKFEAQTVEYTLTVKGAIDPSEDISNTIDTPYTVAQAHELITAGKGLSSKIYVKGIIKKVKEIDTEGTYGNATYFIWDAEGTTDLEVYRGYGLGGQKFNEAGATLIKEGDEVVVYGKVKDFNGTHEFDSGSQIVVLNGQYPAGIQTVIDAQVQGRIFDLQGRSIVKTQRGLNIVGGHKVLVK